MRTRQTPTEEQEAGAEPADPGFYFAHGQEDLLHSLQTQFVETPAGPGLPSVPLASSHQAGSPFHPERRAMQLTHPPKTPLILPLGLDPPTPATPRSPWGNLRGAPTPYLQFPPPAPASCLSQGLCCTIRL
ncbi:ciliary neurotrophic factor receptor, isoform CRA_a [Rattus norvegicus]|uniref:Ciliary neurotrophic factor receptor, isoform CRA_a n=1 Tax=Rattus norvegicus TaxID=10116 RepID=A6IIW3_RAT|nr:ciliary neurotrophic factor receptor, isoform CRA_a [Rattus norvegicus]